MAATAKTVSSSSTPRNHPILLEPQVVKESSTACEAVWRDGLPRGVEKSVKFEVTPLA
jgi:hypothetical protein